MYDHELQDARRQQSSPTQTIPPSSSPKLNFVYDNAHNLKSNSHLSTQSAHREVPLQPSRPLQARPVIHPTQTSRPSSAASVTSTPSIVSISPPLTTVNANHIQTSSNLLDHDSPLPQVSLPATLPVAPTDHRVAHGPISRPQLPHQDYFSHQNQNQSQNILPVNTPQTPHPNSGIPPGRNAQHLSNGLPAMSVPVVAVGPVNGGPGKHLPKLSHSSPLNGFATTPGHPPAQARRASGSALHVPHTHATASPKSTNISPVFLHRIPPPAAAHVIPGIAPSAGHSVTLVPVGPVPVGQSAHQQAPHLHNPSHKPHRPPLINTPQQPIFNHPAPPTPHVSTSPNPIPKTSQGLHLTPSFTNPHSLQSSTSSASIATATSVTQSILATTQASLEHTWNTILSSVDAEVTKLHTVHAGQIRVWADYVESVKKDSESKTAQNESLQRDADRIRRERELSRARAKELELTVVELRKTVERHQRLDSHQNQSEIVAQLQRELQEAKERLEARREEGHGSSSIDSGPASHEVVVRHQNDQDDSTVQVSNVVGTTQPMDHLRSHSDHPSTVQNLQRELTTLKVSHQNLINTYNLLQKDHHAVISENNTLRKAFADLRQTCTASETSYNALKVEYEDLSEKEQKAKIKLGIAEEALKSEKEKAFELDEARKREKKARKEAEIEVAGLKSKVAELERRLAEMSSRPVQKKEEPGQETDDGSDVVFADEPRSRQFQFDVEDPSLMEIQSDSQRCSPRRLSRSRELVDVDAQDIVLPLSPPPTGPSMISPHQRPLSSISPSHVGITSNVESPNSRYDPQILNEHRRSGSVMSVEALSASFLDGPEPSPGVTSMASHKRASNSPSANVHQGGSMARSPVSTTPSPILRKSSPNSISMPQPQIPVEPVTISAPEERMDRASRRSSLPDFRPSSRLTLRATQETQQEAKDHKPPSRSEMHASSHAEKVSDSPISVRGTSLDYDNEHVSPVTTRLPPISSSHQASTSYSRPTSPSYAHNLPRSTSAATRSLRPPSMLGLAENQSASGREDIHTPRLNMDIIRQATTVRMANHHASSQHPSTSSPLVTPSAASHFPLPHDRQKLDGQREGSFREVGEIDEDQEMEEGEEREGHRSANNIRRPDILHRPSSSSSFVNTRNDDGLRDSRRNSPSSQSHSLPPISVEHRRTVVRSPSVTPHNHSSHGEGSNHLVGRNGVNHLKRKGPYVADRDYYSSSAPRRPRDPEYPHAHSHTQSLSHPHPHPHKLLKIIRDGQIVASPVDMDDRDRESIERRRDGRLERSNEPLASVKVQDVHYIQNVLYRSSPPWSPPRSAVPMSISPLSPSSPTALGPLRHSPKTESRVEQSTSNQNHSYEPADSYPNPDRSDPSNNTKFNAKRVLNPPLQPLSSQPSLSPAQIHAGLPAKPQFVEPVSQPSHLGHSRKPSLEAQPMDTFAHRESPRAIHPMHGEGWYPSTNGSTRKPWAVAAPPTNGNGQDQSSHNSSGAGPAPIKQLSFKHIDLLYETIGGEYICRECRASSTANMTKPKSFPTSSLSFTEIFAHYSESHKAKEEEVLKYSHVKLQEQLVQIKGGGNQFNVGRGKKKVGGKKGTK
ncbi:hypothetical protein FB446DRAFT_729091 [Lentinula raphanica]|nr:hypothetical protein FB446DRAFT_729091 [Lentinula raphanica]